MKGRTLIDDVILSFHPEKGMENVTEISLRGQCCRMK
jgi:hypothetical protein